jgi:predicted dehydrogenase
MTTPLRWGVLGAARIAAAKALPALSRTPGAQVRAIASRDADRARALASRFDVPKAYGDYAALLDDRDVDAVYIALPNALHVEWTLASLDCGKHVLCEKPLAARRADAIALAERAASRGVTLVDGFMYRYHPQTQRLFELVAEGAVGSPHTARGAMSFVLDDPGDIRADPGLGGGAALDLGCYVADALCRLFDGEPSRVSGVRRVGPTGVDDTTTAVLDFGDAGTGTLEVSFRLPWIESVLEIHGREGTLRAPHLFNPGSSSPAITLLRQGRQPEEIRFPSTDMFAAMFAAFGDAARRAAEPPFAGDATRVATALELIAALPAAEAAS